MHGNGTNKGIQTTFRDPERPKNEGHIGAEGQVQSRNIEEFQIDVPQKAQDDVGLYRVYRHHSMSFYIQLSISLSSVLSINLAI